MFDPSVRRHPVQTFQFWFVVLTCFVTVTAWKLEFFSHSRPKLPVVSEEPMPPPPGESAPQVEVAAAPLQSETQTENVDAPALFSHNDKPPVSPPLQSEEENSGVVQTASSIPLDHKKGVVHADMQKEQQDASGGAVMQPLQPVPSADFTEVDRLIAENEDVAALKILSGWYWRNREQRPLLMSRLKLLAGRIYFQSGRHYFAPYQVQFGDRIETVAAKFQLTPEYLVKLNRIDSAGPRAGQSIKVIQGPFSAVIGLQEMEMTVHCKGYYLARFPIGLGTDCSIPEGKFTVTEKVLNPDYYGENGVVSHLDPASPLGTRWLTINDEHGSLRAFGIHGTGDPSLIGKIDGPGCVRLQQRDVEMVYDLLTVGSELIIHP